MGWSSRVLLILVCLSGLPLAGKTAENDWFEGTMASDDGATRDYYNRHAGLPWANYMGDWHDANGMAQGNASYATAVLIDDDKPKWVEWDVTTLVCQWVAGTYQNQGMFLRTVGRGGTHVFRSRECADPDQRPRVILIAATGTFELAPEADTYLNPSTYQCFGDATELRVSSSQNLLLRFNLTAFPTTTQVQRATLRLYDVAQYGIADVGVFRCSQSHALPPTRPRYGIAAAYRMDRGITNHPDVIFFTDFESPNWKDEWTSISHPQNGTTLSSDPEQLFEPFDGKACRSRIPEGSTSGMSLSYYFKAETGQEPEEIYFRYYLRFGDNWNPHVDGGKLPGIAGTYGRAGWGGRRSDGTNGWSARGHFGTQLTQDNPLSPKDNPIGYYCYHADMAGHYGDVWRWILGYRGFLENNHWYCIEQYCKMNTPGQNDGILRGWVDGRLAFEKTDIRFRDVESLKIEQIWMNVYHGGTSPTPVTMDLYFDNVVIARSYIGPVPECRGTIFILR